MKISVGVFFGGVSCEHEISCLSASQAIAAINKEKYNVVPVYISKDSDFYTGDALFDIKNYGDLDKLCASLTKVSMVKDGNKVYLRPVKGMFAKNIPLDVAFLVMHGTNGEDGAIQGLMEMMKIPYTSSNILGSAIGQDKALMKEVLLQNGVSIAPCFHFFAHDFDATKEELRQKAKEIGYPLIVKPANLGSSIGIEVIHNEDEFDEKIKEASKYDFKLVVEKMVTALKEVNISVMGSISDARLSEIEEVAKNDELLSFKDKYMGGGKSSKTKMPAKGSKGMASLSRIVPARITEEQRRTVEEMALRSFKALNAEGVVRIDFMIDEDSGAIYVNEINSIPGSLAFYLWEAKGISFETECDMLISAAIKRFREKEKKTYSFDSNVLKNLGR